MGIFTVNNIISAVKLNGVSQSFLPPMILNMSITASIMILFVLLTRLALRKAPKIFSYALWAVVLFRLLCPVSITTGFSLLGLLDTPAVENSQHTTAMEYIPYDVVHTPDPEVRLPVPPVINEVVNEALPQEHAALGADPLEGELAIGSFVWLLGIGAMAVYSVVSYLLLRRKLLGAVLLRDNIYLADGIGSPFVMGFIRPKIYLPSSLSEQEQGYIILHEQHHIRRGDHLIKALAFIALCIHWFNPLVWVAFLLSSKDMEMSCDEAVVKKLGEGIRADYSASLLSLATGRRIIAGTPLAFGEGDTKSRIKNMLNWKKPKTWIIFAALIACVAAIVFCAANPPRDPAKDESMVLWEVDCEYPDAVVDIVNDYVIQQIEYYNDLGSSETAISGEYSILEAKVVNLRQIVATGFADEKRTVELYLVEYRLLPSEPDHVVIAGGMQMEDGWITEWGSTGQPYLALLCDWSSGEEVWTLIGVTNTDQIDTDYNTAEMLAQYHDKYDAAAMELYKAYLNDKTQASYGTAQDVSYYLELAACETFRNMDPNRQTSLLVEYEDLLDNYTLIAREAEDGKFAYIVGQYNGDPTQGPLYGMYSVEVFTGEDTFFQFLYREEESETVDAVLAANKKDFPPSAGYRIEDSRIFWSADSGLILIQPKDAEITLDVPWSRYLHTPNGREYIEDAVSRGIDVCGRTDTCLYVYLISERFGEIAERIALTEAEAQAILAEERVSITEGFGFSASLHIDDQTIYYNERKGIPQTVLDLAVERCDYRFGDPSYITDTIREARLDCDWLDAPLYANEEDLPRLREILKNAEHDFVGACGYGAKLTLTFTGGEKLTVFKGCDSCDSIVFGSYGGYFIGNEENIEFWEMFGLDPDTKTRVESTYEPKTFVSAFLQSEDVGDLLNDFIPRDLHYDLDTYEQTAAAPLSCYVYYHLTRPQFESFRAALQERLGGMPDEISIDGNWDETGGDPRDVAYITVSGPRSRAEIERLTAAVRQSQGLPPLPPLEEQEQLPEAPPTESDIHNAIMENMDAVLTAYSNGASTTDYLAEAHMILAQEKQSEETYTCYSLAQYAAYRLNGKKYEVIESVSVPTMLTFAWDGSWSLTEFWTPGSSTSVGTVFPPEALAELNGDLYPLYVSDLQGQCDDQAVRYYTAQTSVVPYKTFKPEDVEFSGQTLYISADTMTHDERLAWAQAGPDNGQIWPACTGQYSEGEGCIAYVEKIVAGRYPDLSLWLRFTDGMIASLLLPRASGYDTALPDTMEFQNGKFIYEIVFPTEELTNEGQSLIHLKGTYRYEVDLDARTVSLTVLQ